MNVLLRINLRFYLVMLCGAYFAMLYIFHGNLQTVTSASCDNEGNCFGKSTKSNKHSAANVSKIVPQSYWNVEPKRQVDLTTTVFHSRNVNVLGRERQSSRDKIGSDRSGMIFDLLGASRQHIDQLSETFIGDNKGNNAEAYNLSCFMSSQFPERRFLALEPRSFVYSAYYDERYTDKFVRIMALMAVNSSSRHLKVFCHFQGKNASDIIKQEAIFYEMCENHGKQFGGFILSCKVPNHVINVCTLAVSMEIVAINGKYIPPLTNIQQLNVYLLTFSWNYGSIHRGVHFGLNSQKLVPDQTEFNLQSLNENSEILTSSAIPSKDIHTNKIATKGSTYFQYSICIPPLFGNIDTVKLLEFIELNILLGFQHFIFYVSDLDSAEVYKLLNFYVKQNIVTIVDFKLPPIIQKSMIWYNGQLNAHNDCLYRAMSISRFVAIIDIDEYIVPHNGEFRVTETLKELFADKTVCGLSFQSAFYDPKFTASITDDNIEMGLTTQTSTHRSTVFSKVRTKVFVESQKVFEVGIHHVSKPANEEYRVLKVNTSISFLHHYRSCVPNYGMKCGSSVKDDSMDKYLSHLKKAVTSAYEKIFSEVLKL
ncbi:uncharacterized protein LOC127853554 [Dreissena polymorpha]|uniref:Glycosyltransferase family 92 protein n=1 Tax=Dreissena polymorpha TaxID=45954 RepID=A0A9D4CMV0_DREPO|nr:uncharacterized protein LOC127853554 [Dreissena polymorpha]XP_052244104.1 uncharacterized protein LOC127853554 [Dreissena polymorpha]KAH3727115.1 hypothetical protein DPMN_053040 [Dreissena polymorpha]